MKRRFCGALLAVLTVALTAVAVAAADPPLKESNPPEPVSYPAGFVCPFAVTLTPAFGKGKEVTHFDKDGNVRWIHPAGAFKMRVTNDATGESLDLNISGPGKVTFGADGTAFIDGTGPWLLEFFPTDSPSLTLLFFKQGVRFHVEPDGDLVLDDDRGSARDICAELT